jgi:hypothetical protein
MMAMSSVIWITGDERVYRRVVIGMFDWRRHPGRMTVTIPVIRHLDPCQVGSPKRVRW